MSVHLVFWFVEIKKFLIESFFFYLKNYYYNEVFNSLIFQFVHTEDY